MLNSLSIVRTHICVSNDGRYYRGSSYSNCKGPIETTTICLNDI